MNVGTRNQAILRQRLHGRTYRSIADEHGITPGRVRQIVWEMATLPEERKRQRAETEERRLAHQEAMRLTAQSVERQQRRTALTQAIAPIVAHWNSLNGLGYWLQERRAVNKSTREYDEAWDMLTKWFEGNANETMTVLRLRQLAARLTAEPEGEEVAA